MYSPSRSTDVLTGCDKSQLVKTLPRKKVLVQLLQDLWHWRLPSKRNCLLTEYRVHT